MNIKKYGAYYLVTLLVNRIQYFCNINVKLGLSFILIIEPGNINAERNYTEI